MKTDNNFKEVNMKYIIHAMEKENEGKYGIDKWALVELPNLDQVVEYAYEVCISLMQNYSTIDRAIQKEIAQKVKKSKGTDAEEISHQVYREHAMFNIFQVNEEQYPTWQIMSREYLKDKAKFATEQCKQII